VQQLSPFRYPGGKTWLVPRVIEWLRNLRPRPSTFVDPFTGGGSVPLAALSEGCVDKLVLCELDEGVAAVWTCIFGAANEELCQRILTFRISRERVIEELSISPEDPIDKAFQTILKNRTYRGGILAEGASLMKNGENGRGVASRWYPETLARRIRALGELKKSIEVIHGDGMQVIAEHRDRANAVIFADPPYTVGNGKRAGRRLYKHNQLDHKSLFQTLSHARASVLMTYDDAPEVIDLAYRFGFKIDRVPMKNTHHEKKNELLITTL